MRVQARDTALEDAPSTTIAEALGVVERGSAAQLATVQLHIATLPRDTTVWAHVDVDRDGRVSVGDFVTTASYPVAAGAETQIEVRVKRV